MDAASNIASSPFAHQGSSVSGVMLQVCLALVPCTLLGLYLFGWPAIFLFLITCSAALLTELVCLKLLRQSWYRILDGSALLTGWLIAITLPPWAPWWMGVLGAFFALAVGKHLYGGMGQNIFNPAMLARTALLITFPLQMTLWVMPIPLGSAAAPSFFEGIQITFLAAPIADGITGATSLGHLKTSLSMQLPASEVLANDFEYWQAFIGLTAGSMGETSSLLLLAGGLYLIWRGVIRWEIPLALLLTVALISLIFSLASPSNYPGPLFHLSSGGLMLGAFFIATDPVTSPISRTAKLLFGIGCGLLIFILRAWGGFPEAVAFAVLFMNALTPLLDRYIKPRVYGRLNSGQPLPQMTSVERARGAQKRQ